MLIARRPALARPASTESRSGAPRWKDARVWAFLSTYALGAFPAAFVLYESALYLSAAMHKSQIEIGRVLWIPPLGWETGYFFWGWIIDRFAGAGASIPALRRLFLILTCLSLPLAAASRTSSFAAVLALLFLAMFISAGFILGSVVYATCHYSTRHSAWIAGLGAGSWSAVNALVMPGVGRLFDLRSYDTAFAVAALFPIVGWSLWRVLNRTSRSALVPRA
jgi:ACS family hexuronate transporter-like MFS transporter